MTSSDDGHVVVICYSLMFVYIVEIIGMSRTLASYLSIL